MSFHNKIYKIKKQAVISYSISDFVQLGPKTKAEPLNEMISKFRANMSAGKI